MTTKVKPTVRFVGDPEFFNYHGQKGKLVASVKTLDHPVWGNDIVRTSLVVKKNKDGSFETLNTLYVSA